MRIAQVAPLFESVPPKLYGGTERVVSYLTENSYARATTSRCLPVAIPSPARPWCRAANAHGATPSAARRCPTMSG